MLCARRRDCPDESRVNGVWVHRAGFDSLKEVVYFALHHDGGRGRVGGGVPQPRWWTSLLGWLYTAFWKKIYFPDDAMLWYFPARRKARQLARDLAFDAFISVSLPFTGHLIGKAVKQMAPATPWLADIGDPFTIQAQPLNNPWLYGRLSRRLESRILEMADAGVVTHTGALRAYRKQFGAVAQKLLVIPPLLHPAWAPESAAVSPVIEVGEFDSNAVHLGYFGAFYAPVRTPDAFLEVLDRTLAENPAWRDKLRVHFFGEIFPEFWDKMAKHPNLRLYGLRSREEIRAAMMQMDILLHIGNVTDFQLPSKAVEYLASGKPVIHFSYVSDDPFVAFWGNTSDLAVVQVENGRVTDHSVPIWLAALERVNTAAPSTDRAGRNRAFEIGAIAGAYETAIWRTSPPRSTSGIPATPGNR